MTTEIAVINRLGVALAADSAVTIPGYGADKVFNTGDKLFELSERYPVALMVNGSMDFLGVPWEIIAKEFRCTTPDGAATLTIKQWMERFLNFLAGHPTVKPGDVRRWQDGLIEEELDSITAIVRDRLEAAAAEDGEQNIHDVLRGLYTTVMAERVQALAQNPLLESLAGVTVDAILPTVRSIVAELETQRIPFDANADQREFFANVIAQRLLSDLDRLTATGLIVAGFGGKDLFPSLYAVDIDGFIAGQLRYRASHDVTISRGEDTGTAISFAQTDVVDRLLKGTDNRFIDGARAFIKENVSGSLERNFTRLKLKISRSDGSEISPSEMGGLLGDLIASQFESKFAANLRTEFERKFKETIALMPKQDLIELAEALVSITAIERKASDDAGTVGGPIDVALITRAEGFVWIKRKHHFKADLNPRYMWRRFGKHTQEGSDEEE
ncbi:hypothetical protein [Mesorhizobium helmanticense]|uniref:Uncharacterized protein n=1 Tax=Mesorhizobium helmanticense TaxID=1776423 RepID=A0A2T4IWR0_9HYPH|nr:hypothetical protein [Mesorhizobium helmanticense]PTE10071.1 hypothetical protein C9427_13220 [Mesorhizobium helmanticense]